MDWEVSSPWLDEEVSWGAETLGISKVEKEFPRQLFLKPYREDGVLAKENMCIICTCTMYVAYIGYRL